MSSSATDLRIYEALREVAALKDVISTQRTCICAVNRENEKLQGTICELEDELAALRNGGLRSGMLTVRPGDADTSEED